MITLALSKGRILDETLPLLAAVGIELAENPETSRKLIVGTSAARTRMSRRFARLVAKMSLREASASSVGMMPARASSGSASSKMRPLARAKVIMRRA